MDKRICIVTLVGLPGSGKTHFTRSLVAHFGSLNYSVIPITYDNYIHNITNEADCKWKDMRKRIYNKVQDLISIIRGQLKECDGIFTHNMNIGDGAFNDEIIIIIDDNMYYRSMRYEYYKLAKEHRLGFCQIYLKATLQQALDSNSKRDSSDFVSNSIIEKMDKLIEVPDLSNRWEKLSLVVPCFRDLDKIGEMDNIDSLIRAGFNSPVESNINKPFEPTKTPVETNLVHRFDICFRSAISESIKRLKLSEQNVNDAAKKFNQKRKDTLENLRLGNITLPANITSALLDINDTGCKQLVHNYLQNILCNIV